MSGSNSSSPAAAEPAEPLSFTVHSLPQPEEVPQADARRTRLGRWKMLAVLLVCASPVIASYLTYFVIRPQERSNYSELVQPPVELPALPLTDLDGRAVDAATLKGQWLLVVVGPGACDAACEKRLYVQRQLRETTGRERDRIDKLWLVTDDAPVRPELRSALGAAAAATHILRVPAAALADWLSPEVGESLESHLYIVDPMGMWMMRAPVNPDPARLKRDIDRLLRASSFWDRPGR
jgi:hypothetical protein